MTCFFELAPGPLKGGDGFGLGFGFGFMIEQRQDSVLGL